MLRKKIILFFPGKYSKEEKPDFPLSSLALVSPLREAGFEPIILDARIEDWKNSFEEKIDNEVLFVGVSSLTSDMILYGLDASRWIKRRYPQIPVVWGGIHASLLPEQTINTGKFIDIVVRGEGEDIVVELANGLREGVFLKDIRGISFKSLAGIISNPDPIERVNLDSLKLPPYDILDFEKYTRNNFLYMSARGCPYKCRFCEVTVFHHNRYSAKSVEKTLDELEYIVSKYHPENIEFVDEDFFINMKRAMEICQGIIDRGLNFKWIAACRANYFRNTSEEYWEVVKKSGARQLYIGAESGSEITLRKIEKQITVNDIYNAAKQLTNAGIHMSCNFIIGFPEETEEDIKATLKLAKDLEFNYGKKGLIVGGINIYMPYPGSQMYYEVQKYGFKPPEILREWGNLILNDAVSAKWNPTIKYFHRVSIVCRVCRWKVAGSLREVFQGVRARKKIFAKFKEAIKVILQYLAIKRWKAMNFKYPIDIKLAYFIEKYVTRYG